MGKVFKCCTQFWRWLFIVLNIIFFVDIVEDRVTDAVTDYRLNSSSSGYQSDVNNFIDFVQESFDCCGYSSSAEWKTTIFFNESNGLYPESCECMVQDCGKCAPPLGSGERCNDSVPVNDSLQQYIWVEGCNSSVVDQLEDNLGIIAGVGVAFGLFEISGVAIALGLCICACVRRGKEDDIELDDYVY